MTRPVYESDRDRAKERRVVEEIAKRSKLRIELAPRFYPCDAFGFDPQTGDLRSLIEVKCRDHDIGTYPTLHVSAQKLTNIIGLATLGAPVDTAIAPPPVVVVVAALNDGAFWMSSRYPYEQITGAKRVYGGRRDRGDPDDMEVVVELPMTAFRRF